MNDDACDECGGAGEVERHSSMGSQPCRSCRHTGRQIGRRRMNDLERKMADAVRREAVYLDEPDLMPVGSTTIARVCAEVAEQRYRDRLAEAFIRGFEAGAERPEDAGDGDAMYQAFRQWRDRAED